jgi:hypothetical protein
VVGSREGDRARSWSGLGWRGQTRVTSRRTFSNLVVIFTLKWTSELSCDRKGGGRGFGRIGSKTRKRGGAIGVAWAVHKTHLILDLEVDLVLRVVFLIFLRHRDCVVFSREHECGEPRRLARPVQLSSDSNTSLALRQADRRQSSVMPCFSALKRSGSSHLTGTAWDTETGSGGVESIASGRLASASQ